MTLQGEVALQCLLLLGPMHCSVDFSTTDSDHTHSNTNHWDQIPLFFYFLFLYIKKQQEAAGGTPASHDINAAVLFIVILILMHPSPPSLAQI